jgi:AcrR family transcriptional regulator
MTRRSRAKRQPDKKTRGKTADRLLEAAADLFRRKGYAGTSTREIAESLGIRKASLYHHIATKEELLETLCRESLRRLTDEVSAVTANPKSRLRAIIEVHMRTAVRERDMHITMLLDHGALAPKRRAAVVAARDRYQALIRDVIRADQKAGRLRADIDAKQLTLALLNLLNWTIFWFDPADEKSAPEIAGILAEVFLRGAEPR